MGGFIGKTPSEKNSNYETLFNAKSVPTTNHQAIYSENSKKYTYNELTGTTEEPVLADFVEQIGHIHPLIFGFYQPNSATLDTRYHRNNKEKESFWLRIAYLCHQEKGINNYLTHAK